MTDLNIINKLVDMTLSEKEKCPEGYKWCNIRKKCIEDPEAKKGKGRGLHRGQTKGPMGKPFTKQNEMFAADMPEFEKVEKIVDVIVDSSITECPESEPNAVKNIPTDDSNEEIDRVHYDIAGYNDPEDVEDEYPPGPQDDDGGIDDVDDENLLGNRLEAALREQESGYKKFFKTMMDKEGIKDIGDLSNEKKKEFFNKVDRLWKAKNESLQEKGEYQRFFKRMMDEEGVTGIATMSPDQKSAFFKKVSTGWKKEKGKSVAESFSNIIK